MGSSVTTKLAGVDIEDFYNKKAAGRTPIVRNVLASPFTSVTANAGASCSIGSAAVSVVDGESVYTVTATSSAATNNWFEINAPVTSTEEFLMSSATVEYYANVHANVTSMIVYVGNSGYAIYSNYSYTPQTESTSGSEGFSGVLTAFQIDEGRWTKNGYAGNTSDQVYSTAKIRVYVLSGQTVTFSLRSISVGSLRRKARIAIVADDCILSWITTGVQLCREHGFASTMAVITGSVGSAGYATLNQLKAFVKDGNECIPHGPNGVGGASGNLFTQFSNNADRISDMLSARRYLANNGLTGEYGEKCYAWPQGVHSDSATDHSMMTLAMNNGFRACRIATAGSPRYRFKASDLSEKNIGRMAMPIIGHSWSATDEAANIAAVQANIDSIVTGNMDGVLMLHKVVGTPAADIQISPSNLRAIFSTMKGHVLAGSLDVVLFSQFAV